MSAAKIYRKYTAEVHGRTVATVYRSQNTWEVHWRAFKNIKTFRTKCLAQEYINSYYDAVAWTVSDVKRPV